MIDEALRALIAFVESASPVVWAAAQQEVAVRIVITIRIMFTVFTFSLLLFALGSFSIYKCKQHDWPEDDVWFAGIFLGFIFGIVCLLIAFSKWNQVTALQMNPEYQAIKIISQLVMGTSN